jgi:hypothetical protein
MTFTKNISDEKKQKASSLLNNIASTIEDAIQKFKNNEIPHGSCEQMRLYSKEFHEILTGIVDYPNLHEYADRLYHAHDIENWLMSVRENSQSLVELEKAAGYFRASATLIKLK